MATSVSIRVLEPPRAAAGAGIIFSLLLIASLVIIRIVAASSSSAGVWLSDPTKRGLVRFALALTPFAGIAFLWFIGVVRNRLGALEDQFFATVFLGSGLLFIGSLFSATAIAGALLETLSSPGQRPLNDEVLRFAGRTAQAFLNTFAIRTAGVFIFSTCMIGLRTAILPRWLVFSGFACGVILLLVITSWQWIALLFPVWILVVSTQILTRTRADAHATSRPDRL